MRSHGSGQACYRGERIEGCDECAGYFRKRLAIQARTPGTHRYQAIHGIGRIGEKQNDYSRKVKRANQAKRDDALWHS